MPSLAANVRGRDWCMLVEPYMSSCVFVSVPPLTLCVHNITSAFICSTISDTMIMDAIASYLVLPNRLTVPLVPDLQIAQLRSPLPRVTVSLFWMALKQKKTKESVKMLFFLAIASLTDTPSVSLSSSFGAFNAVFHYTWELLAFYVTKKFPSHNYNVNVCHKWWSIPVYPPISFLCHFKVTPLFWARFNCTFCLRSLTFVAASTGRQCYWWPAGTAILRCSLAKGTFMFLALWYMERTKKAADSLCFLVCHN